MANPQKESGSTMIANEVLEKIYSFPFTGREIKVLLFVIRKTWGWHKKEDKISYNQIARGCYITRRNAIYTIKELVSKQALVVKGGYINIISFNKDYEQWIVSKQALVPKMTPSVEVGTTLVSKQALKLVSKQAPTKEKKYTYTKDIHASRASSNNKDLNEVVSHLEETLSTKIVNWGKQAKALFNMLKAGYTKEQIKKTITYMATRDDFFSDKGFDLQTVANQISRYKAEEVKRHG